MLCSNTGATQFYLSNGFRIKEKLLGYYTGLDPPDCYILEKNLKPGKDNNEEVKD